MRDLFTPARGKRSGGSFLINLTWLFAPLQHSSWVLFEHLASSLPGGYRALWQMSTSRHDPPGVGFVAEGGHPFVLGPLGHPADVLECATRRPAPGTCYHGEGEEMNSMGKISGYCQLWGGDGPPPSLPLTYPFEMSCLVFTILLPQPRVS